MKSIIIATIFLITGIFSVLGQTYTNNIADKDIKDFFSWRTNHKYHKNEVRIKRVCKKITAWDSQDLDFLNPPNEKVKWYYNEKSEMRFDSILTDMNKEFISQQIQQLSQKSVWRRKTFGGQWLVKDKSHDKIHRWNSYWAFSVPLFTLDKQYCFVDESYFCGMMCAEWRLQMYKKTSNGKWVLVMTIFGMSS